MCPLGLDATVSWGGPEFKFVNNREYPVKILAWVEGNQCMVQILGTDVDGSYVEMTVDYWINSDESTGARSWRWVYDANGNLLSKTKESESRYHVHKQEEETPTPQPSPTPEASPQISPEPAPESTESVQPTPETSAEPTPEAGTQPTPEAPVENTEAPAAEPGPATESDIAA